MEQFLILSHIICGTIVLLLGLAQMFNRKGSSSHIILGKAYVGAMWWICLSAWAIIIFYRFSAFLMVIAVLTFYASFVGVRVLKRKKVGAEKWYDWAVAIATCLFGAGLVLYAGYLFLFSNQTILAFLCLVFGLFTLVSALQDIRFFLRKPEMQKAWWLRQHISAMGGSYIAAITAFAVQNPNLFMPDSSLQWLLWILPGIIGGPIISRATRKWMSKMA